MKWWRMIFSSFKMEDVVITKTCSSFLSSLSCLSKLLSLSLPLQHFDWTLSRQDLKRSSKVAFPFSSSSNLSLFPFPSLSLSPFPSLFPFLSLFPFPYLSLWHLHSSSSCRLSYWEFLVMISNLDFQVIKVLRWIIPLKFFLSSDSKGPIQLRLEETFEAKERDPFQPNDVR